jgi:methyl-accepting chemotaxis protein
VPRVPQEVLEIHTAVQRRGAQEELIITNLSIAGIGGIMDIAAPILAGVAGYGHVGMARNIIRAQIWSAVMEQQGLMFMIFLVTVLVAYVLVNHISQPLNLLAEHARTLASEDFVTEMNVPTELDFVHFSAHNRQLVPDDRVHPWGFQPGLGRERTLDN